MTGKIFAFLKGGPGGDNKVDTTTTPSGVSRQEARHGIKQEEPPTELKQGKQEAGQEIGQVEEPVAQLASGGQVPGSGNRDTVPAMLTPGEFVMNKASTAKIGVQNLMKMNANMGKGILGGAKKLAMKHPLAQMAKGIGNLVGGAKDKLGEMMGGGDEDKVIGIAVADIPKGSPLMKSAKPPAGDTIKPPTKSSDKGGVSLISGGGSGGGGQNMAGVGGGKMVPLIDTATKISGNKVA